MTAPRRLARLPARTLPGGLRVATATGPRGRLLGLAWLDPIPDGWALLLPRCRSVHTFWMRFALDLVWLDADGRVVRIDEDVRPRRIVGCRTAAAVLETRSGRGADFAGVLPGG